LRNFVHIVVDTPLLDIVIAVTFISQVKVRNAFQCLATLSVVCYWGMSLLMQLLCDLQKDLWGHPDGALFGEGGVFCDCM